MDGGSWVWGINPVVELIAAAPRAVRCVRVLQAQRRGPVSDLVASAQAAGIPVVDGEPPPGASSHHAVAAEIEPFPYVSAEEIAKRAPDLIVALDCVQDPRNLGAILRTCAATAAGGVILPRDRSVGVTPAVVRGAAGLAYRVPIARVSNLARAIADLKDGGWWALGLAADQGETLFDVPIPGRVLLVLGGEGRGLRPLIARGCDRLISIPMAQGIDSLNVSVAAGVALYEIARRRRPA